MPNPIHLLSGSPATLRQFVPEEPPPLASAICVLVSTLPDCHNQITSGQKRYPWCPLILIADQITFRPDMLRLLLLDPPRHAAVTAARSITELAPEQLRRALRTRLPATAAAIVEYLWRRGLSRRLQAAVELALSMGIAGETAKESAADSRHPVASTLNRQLRRLGPLTAADWRAVLRILTALEALGDKVEQVAWDSGIDPRTLRSRTQRLLGLPVAEALALPGWEWKLESALRHFGYAREPGRRGSSGKHGTAVRHRLTVLPSPRPSVSPSFLGGGPRGK